MPTNRYVHGSTTNWSGYCEYDWETHRYMYYPVVGNPTETPTPLRPERLAALIQGGYWAPGPPMDQQLPAGF